MLGKLVLPCYTIDYNYDITQVQDGVILFYNCIVGFVVKKLTAFKISVKEEVIFYF